MNNQIERVFAQFKDESGKKIGAPMELHVDVNSIKLSLLYNAVFNKTDTLPYLFFVDDIEIKDSLKKALQNQPTQTFESEKVVYITVVPQAVYRVRPVTRCSSSMPGHAEAVISASFSSDGKLLASGSGDTTVRFWDISTTTPVNTCRGHRNWVLVIAWAPNCLKLASACKNGHIIIWNGKTGEQIGNTLTGHRQWVNFLAWEPLHRLVLVKKFGLYQ